MILNLYDHEAEKNVLGSILLDNQCLKIVRGIVSPEDFADIKNRLVYQAMLNLVGAIDHGLLASELKKQGHCEKTGGVLYLSELTDHVVTVANVEHHAQIVADHAVARKIQTAGVAITKIVNLGLPVSDLRRQCLDTIKKATINDKGAGSAVSARDYVAIACDEALDSEPLRGIVMTHMGRLDSEYGGLYPGVPYLLAARPSMGKSTIALNMVIEACLMGKRVVLFSFEESRRFVMWRILSRLSQVVLSRIKNRRLTDDERTELRLASDIVKTFDLTIYDRPLSAQQISDVCEYENDKRKLDLPVIDLLTKVKTPNSYGNKSGHQEYSDISKVISEIPGLIEAPLLALHQLNRSVENRNKGKPPENQDYMPVVSDLRESGTLEETFKGIFFILRPYAYNTNESPNQMFLRIAKMTDGPTGTIELHCDLPRMTIRALAEDRY